MATPLPPAPVVGPTVPWLLGGHAAAPSSLVPPAILRNMTPAQQIAMSLNSMPATTPVGRSVLAQAVGGGGASPAATRVAQQVASTPSFMGGAGAAGVPGTGAAGGLAQAAAPAAGAAGGLAQAAAPAAGGGRLAQLLGLGGQGAAGSAAARTGLVARLGGPAALKSAGLYAAGGYLAGQGVESVTGSREGTWDDALRNATVGAGIGGGLGTLGGPFAPLTVPVGMGLGGIVGGVHGFLTGRGSKEGEATKAYESQVKKFTDQFSQYAVSPELQDQFMMQFALATDGLGRGEVNEVAKQMRALLPQVIQEDLVVQEEERGRAAMVTAAQAWMAPMMQGAMDRSTQYADQLSQSMIGSSQYIEDPAARAFAVESANRIKLDTASQQAYAAQMMMSLPGIYGMNTQTGSNGVPNMDFQSIINAMPMAGPNGQVAQQQQQPQQQFQPLIQLGQ